MLPRIMCFSPKELGKTSEKRSFSVASATRDAVLVGLAFLCILSGQGQLHASRY